MAEQQDQIDSELQFTQNLRKTLIKKILTSVENPNLPEDKTSSALLTSLMDGMDRVNLTKMRIKSDEKQNAEGYKALVASFLSSVNAKDLALESQNQQPLCLDMPDDLATQHDKVKDPRQMYIGTQHITIESIENKSGE